MASVTQTDHSQKGKMISYMNAQTDLLQCFTFSYFIYGAYSLCQVERLDYVI